MERIPSKSINILVIGTLQWRCHDNYLLCVCAGGCQGTLFSCKFIPAGNCVLQYMLSMEMLSQLYLLNCKIIYHKPWKWQEFHRIRLIYWLWAHCSGIFMIITYFVCAREAVREHYIPVNFFPQEILSSKICCPWKCRKL